MWPYPKGQWKRFLMTLSRCAETKAAYGGKREGKPQELPKPRL